MSVTSPFSGSALKVQSATAQATLTAIRVRFTQDPLAANPAGANDALNPANFSLSGPEWRSILSVSTVVGDPQSVDLHLEGPMVTGSWTVTAANIQTALGNPLVAPTSATFLVTKLTTNPIVQGAVNETAESVLRKHHNHAMSGTYWNALIAGIATGDDYNWGLGRSAFDQMFVPTASGIYLDYRASDRGLIRPANVGMGDDLFRQYIIKLTSQKLTQEVLYEILEVFYGTDATRAWMKTDLTEPFNLQANEWITFRFDGRVDITTFFHAANFESIAAATATEVAAALTYSFITQGLKAFALPYTDPVSGENTVRVYSSSLGLRSSVQALGGSAQNKLQFPTLLSTVTAAQSWTITTPRPDVMRVKIISGAPIVPDLNLVRVGDYVNIYGQNFNAGNKGSFTITAMDVRWVAGNLEQYFEVTNPGVFAQVVVQATNNDMLFFRPTKSIISGARTVVASQTSLDTVDFLLPATTQAVLRHKGTGAYVQARSLLVPTSVERHLSGAVTFSFASNHNLSTGEWVILDDLVPLNTVPSTTAGNGTTTTDYNPVTGWSTLQDIPKVTPEWGQAYATIGNKVFAFGGASGAFVPGANTLYRTTCIFNVSGSALQTNGSTQYTYSWAAAVGALTSIRIGAKAIALTDSWNANNILIVGGKDNISPLAKSQIYDTVNDAMGVEILLGTARTGFGVSMLSDNTVLVTGGWNGAAIVASTEIFTSSGALAGGFTTVSSMNMARQDHGQVTLSDGRVLVVGGITTGSTYLHTCEVRDLLGNWTYTGDMSYYRQAPAVVLLPNDRVLVIGGAGNKVGMANPGPMGYLKTAEIWDPVTGRWYPAGQMSVPRATPQAHLSGNRVVVFGSEYPLVRGWCDFLDTRTLKWTVGGRPQNTVAEVSLFAHGLLANGTLFVGGGLRLVGLGDSNKQFLLTPESDTLSSRGLSSQLFKITGTTATTFTVQADAGWTRATNSTMTVLPATAVASNFPGPYLVSPREGVTIAGTATTTTSAMSIGQQYNHLNVADATQFPDEEGYLSLGFGGELALQPIKYYGRYSSTALIIDASYRFPWTVGVGTTVTLLTGRVAWEPSNPTSDGLLFATAVAAGRVAASSTIDEVVAAGINVNKTIQYPSDRGLGNEGGPIAGTSKLSDKVVVWGSDDVDQELKLARGE